MGLNMLTAHEASILLKKREVSAEELIKDCLERIEQVEGKIHALNTICREDALRTARGIDRKRSAGEGLPALAGIPVVIKDNMCTKGVKTTCSSRMLENFIPPYDATVVQKLAENGCVMIAKSNMDEFAMGSSNENSYFGPAKNPYDITHVPGGSSGGSAASVAADETLLAFGSDTGGSIRQPASLCGIVGMKPTYGAVSRYGLIAFASSLDQIGPMAKDVEDCAMALSAIAGYDEKDSTSANITHENYQKILNSNVKGLKIALPKEYFTEGLTQEVKDAVMQAVRNFEGLGAIIEEASMPTFGYALNVYYILSSAEASSNLSRYDGVKYGHSAEGAEDIVSLYKKTRGEGFGDEVKRRIMLGNYVLSAGYYDAYYLKALKVRTLVKRDFDMLFE
ncbi:MAG: Asp-tRNA(Asn)/Glu-tRNA(Gln) amidotransferase subunit GatA, partial [Bacillota bacterium]|nr:Asp-tRNA(Asn)/Glu-tRNA(Gln) amidotransferase subunit GatA [Bacillota bacterium]